MSETEGAEIALAYAVGLNAADALIANGQEDWVVELIRKSFKKLSPAAQLMLTESK